MRVAVVGAGITGLALTHYLADSGVDSVTFEAEPEPGGVINTRRVDGRVLEVGPQRVRRTSGLEELAAAADVADRFVEAGTRRLYVYADGRLREVPLAPREFLGSDLLSPRGKLRLLAEPLTRPGMEAETVEGLFVRKFGREAYERFIGPLFGGLYGSDPGEMPAAFALEGLLERERETGSFLRAFRQRVSRGSKPPPVSFEDGLQQLPDALYDRYSDRIRLATPVERVARDGGGGLRVETPGDSHAVDHVVLTTPAPATAELLPEDTAGADRLADLGYNPFAFVFLDAAGGREGFGYQVGFGEKLHTLGVSWNASMFDRDGVHTAFLGGMYDPGLTDEPADAVGEIAAAEFETVTGRAASVIDVATPEWGVPAWDHSWWGLEELDLPADITLATNYTARMGVPSRIREARAVAADLA